MAANDETRQSGAESGSDDTVEVKAFDLRVGAGGRLTIPDEKRERYGIEQGDFVDAVFTVENTDGGE